MIFHIISITFYSNHQKNYFSTSTKIHTQNRPSTKKNASTAIEFQASNHFSIPKLPSTFESLEKILWKCNLSRFFSLHMCSIDWKVNNDRFFSEVLHNLAIFIECWNENFQMKNKKLKWRRREIERITEKGRNLHSKSVALKIFLLLFFALVMMKWSEI